MGQFASWAPHPGLCVFACRPTTGGTLPLMCPSLWSLQHEPEPSVTVHMWQMPVHPQEPVSPSQLTLSRLPLVWQLYSGRRYRAMDTRLWEIVSHGQASVWWPQERVMSGRWSLHVCKMRQRMEGPDY